MEKKTLSQEKNSTSLLYNNNNSYDKVRKHAGHGPMRRPSSPSAASGGTMNLPGSSGQTHGISAMESAEKMDVDTLEPKKNWIWMIPQTVRPHWEVLRVSVTARC